MARMIRQYDGLRITGICDPACMTDAQANVKCKALALKMTPVYCRVDHAEVFGLSAERLAILQCYRMIRDAMVGMPRDTLMNATVPLQAPLGPPVNWNHASR